MPRQMDELHEALSRSKFRSKFKLDPRDLSYLHDKGLGLVMKHASDFIDQRLAPAHPERDGKQTPWRGHPVFVAQHATATCCRGCVAKWHGIPAGVELTPEQRKYLLGVIEHWLKRFEAPNPGLFA